MEHAEQICKYCRIKLDDCHDEGLTCSGCSKSVHIRCLKSGGIPGALYGDVFFIFRCQECSPLGNESFIRDKISWCNIIVLTLYHLQKCSPGLARKGFFHWRNHVAALIDKNWEILFPREFKRKKKWIGTVAGTLSHFSTYFFKSGVSVVNEQAWWALTYPKLNPNIISKIYAVFIAEKQKAKVSKTPVNNKELFQKLLRDYVKDDDLLTPHVSVESVTIAEIKESNTTPPSTSGKKLDNLKRKSLLPTLESTSKRLIKLGKMPDFGNLNEELAEFKSDSTSTSSGTMNFQFNRMEERKEVTLLDPLCHYNTSLNTTREKGVQMRMRLTGGLRKELILSPYSGIYLKPYIRRDTETYPKWLQLMTEIQLKVNRNNLEFQLAKRAPLDYTYVQPEHIPAINSLCNHYFWPGIDLTDCLQYPDFSCVVMYKKLIVAFAFLVPNVKYTENYISFLFTRPGWRNAGIAKFMIYHLIQTSMGKDITLHVSINNPALFLYQKFGFKVESVELYFYEKYLRSDTKESKHAFFCRLER